MATLAPSPPWASYAAGSTVDHFAWWARKHCRHFLGPFAGQPLELEPWQVEFLGEAMAVGDDNLPFWATALLIVPRKNGKTTLFAAIAAYHADQDEQGPRVGLAATSDEQASELFDAVDAFIAASPYLSDRFHVRDYEGEIARTDAGGYINRMRMDWRRLHGKNLSLLLPDEIHAWTTPNLRRCWEALTTGDAARPGFQTLGITTEGEPDPEGEGILTSLVAENERYGEVERRPGLTVSRHFEGRVLVYRFHADLQDADPAPVRESFRAWRDAAGTPEEESLRATYEAARARCAAAAKRANPASWISESYLGGKAVHSKLTRSAFLRFHCCIQAAAEEGFLSEHTWDAIGDATEPIAPGRDVDLGADGSRTHDSTVVAWASRAPDGRIDVDARIFSAVTDSPHHVLHPGGRIDYDDVEAFIGECWERFRVGDAAYDPTYLDRSADLLVDRLPETRIFPVEPSSKHMREALATFERLCIEGVVRHRGDRAIRHHVMGAIAVREADSDRLRKIRKRHSEWRIDAVPAMAMAVWRASRRPPRRSWRPAA